MDLEALIFSYLLQFILQKQGFGKIPDCPTGNFIGAVIAAYWPGTRNSSRNGWGLGIHLTRFEVIGQKVTPELQIGISGHFR